MRYSSLLFLLLFLSSLASANHWNVGPSQTYTTPAAVAGLVNDGDTIFIDAALYANHPQVQFSKNNLHFIGINGRPRLEAGAALANNSNGKAIFVISGSDVTVENIEFANAAVPDNNGAGIRQEGCDLTVTNCFFTANEMGILGGALPSCTVRLEHNVFSNNGSTSNPGYQHNVYMGNIDSLIFRYNYSINAIAEGHELKSRANTNIIMYNYIGNLSTEDSRTIDLPNGGTVVMVGNIIQQGPSSANSNIFGYGQEGLLNAGPHNLWITNNTFVNKKSTGNFIQLQTGTNMLFLKNNIMVGPKTSGLIQGTPTQLDTSNNLISDDINAPGFIWSDWDDFHLSDNSPAINKGIQINQIISGYPLSPKQQYVETAKTMTRPVDGTMDLGAFEFPVTTSVKSIPYTSLRAYPNPCTDVIFVKDVKDNAPYRIHNLQGQYVMGGIVINGKMDVSKIPTGYYILEINGEVLNITKE